MKKKTIMQYPLNAGRVAAVVFALGGLSILYFYVLGSMNASHAPTRVMVPVTTGDTESTTSKSTKSYQSASLNIAFEYPSEYQIVEDLTTILIETGVSGRNIVVNKYGTPFLSTKLHVDNSIFRRQDSFVKRQSLMGKQFEIEQVEYVIQGERQIVYYLVKDYFIYQLETNDPELFSDLDTIARSFQITE